MKTFVLVAALIAGSVVGVAGCATAPKDEAGKEALSGKVQSTLAAFKSADPGLNDLLGRSLGYAVFPEVGKAGLVAGGAYGRGEVFEGGKRIGFADISQATLGLQIGAETYDEIVIFVTHEKLDEFKTGKFAFSANASAVAIKAGASSSADYSKGVIVFTKATGGLMAEASIGGQKFNFQPLP